MRLEFILSGIAAAVITLDTNLAIPVINSVPIIWPSPQNGQAYIWSDDSFYNQARQAIFTNASLDLTNIDAEINGYLAGQLHFTNLNAVFYPLNQEYEFDIDSLQYLQGQNLDNRASNLLNELFKQGFQVRELEFNCLNSTLVQAFLSINSMFYVGDARLTGTVVSIKGPAYVLPRLLKSNKLLVSIKGVKDISRSRDGGIRLRVDGYGKISAIANIKSLKGPVEFKEGTPTFRGASTLQHPGDNTNPGGRTMSTFKIAGIVVASLIFVAILFTFVLVIKNYKD